MTLSELRQGEHGLPGSGELCQLLRWQLAVGDEDGDEPAGGVPTERHLGFHPIIEPARVERLRFPQQLADTQTHPVDGLVHLGFDPVDPWRTVVEVDDVAHLPEATQIDLAGYRSCRNEHCGALVLLEITWRTDGLCTGCFQGVLGSKIAEVEVRSRARTIALQRRTRNRSGSKGDQGTRKAADHAARKAADRLRQLFPDLFSVLLAEERTRVGLEPFPLERAIQEPDAMTASEIIDFARVYDALDEHGVDVDVPQDAPT